MYRLVTALSARGGIVDCHKGCVVLNHDTSFLIKASSTVSTRNAVHVRADAGSGSGTSHLQDGVQQPMWLQYLACNLISNSMPLHRLIWVNHLTRKCCSHASCASTPSLPRSHSLMRLWPGKIGVENLWRLILRMIPDVIYSYTWSWSNSELLRMELIGVTG